MATANLSVDQVRVSWTSAAAQAAWQPRIQAASQAWLLAELESVRRGHRTVALVFGRALVAASGLTAVEVAPDRFAVAGSAPEAADMLAAAYKAGNDEMIGSLLGFPACCRAFFARTWGAGAQDTSWQWAVETATVYDIPRAVMYADGPVECNILGRWLGIRYVAHLPCSPTCEHTRRIGLRFREVLPMEHQRTMDEVLSWPVEWSALHGAAEVKFPVLKLVTGTTYTPSKLTVRRQGTRYPAEGGRGVHFPFQKNQKPVAPLEFRRPPYRENGFPSQEAQDACHALVLSLVGTHQTYADLGCGNGALIDKLPKGSWGIEVDASKAHGHPGIIVAKLSEPFTRQADVAIISQRRFEEDPTLEARVRAHFPRVLLYSYDDPQFARFL